MIADIRAAFVEHQVIFFRDQTLSPVQQIAFGRRFGPLNIHPYVSGMANHPEVMEIIKEPSDRTNFGGGWHSDMSFLETPAIGSILHAIELPDWGGDTLFSSQAAAYEALTPAMRATLDTLNAVHSAGREYSASGHSAQKRASMKVVEAEGAIGEHIHPVVLIHPENGRKALYVSPVYMVGIEGMGDKEAQELLTSLFAHMIQPQYIYRHHWTQGAVLLWDNRCTMHMARGGYDGHLRVMHRTTVAGEAPV